MKPVQFFDAAYLRQCRNMTPEQIVRFLDDFRTLHGAGAPGRKSRLISLKVPEDLLRAFRQKAEFNNVRYQTLIKMLMTEWVRGPGRLPAEGSGPPQSTDR